MFPLTLGASICISKINLELRSFYSTSVVIERKMFSRVCINEHYFLLVVPCQTSYNLNCLEEVIINIQVSTIIFDILSYSEPLLIQIIKKDKKEIENFMRQSTHIKTKSFAILWFKIHFWGMDYRYSAEILL